MPQHKDKQISLQVRLASLSADMLQHRPGARTHEIDRQHPLPKLSPYDKVRNVGQELPMTTATLTSKGQITIPASVREALGVGTGDRVEFVEIAAGRYEVIAATNSVTALKGMFGKARRSVSIEEMNATIARRGAAARDVAKKDMPK
jgi:antitoxin PrlF